MAKCESMLFRPLYTSILVLFYRRGIIFIAALVRFGFEHTVELLLCKGPANQNPVSMTLLPLSLHRSLNLAFSASCSQGLCLISDSAVTVDGNTYFVGTSSVVGGGDQSLVIVRFCCSCHVWLGVALRYKRSFRSSSTAPTQKPE